MVIDFKSYVNRRKALIERVVAHSNTPKHKVLEAYLQTSGEGQLLGYFHPTHRNEDFFKYVSTLFTLRSKNKQFNLEF